MAQIIDLPNEILRLILSSTSTTPDDNDWDVSIYEAKCRSKRFRDVGLAFFKFKEWVVLRSYLTVR